MYMYMHTHTNSHGGGSILPAHVLKLSAGRAADAKRYLSELSENSLEPGLAVHNTEPCQKHLDTSSYQIPQFYLEMILVCYFSLFLGEALLFFIRGP